MSERNLTPTRLPERARTDRASLDALLDEVMVAHLGLSLPDGPVAMPCGFARDGDRILLHGSTGSRWMRAIAAGAPVCLTVTALDALIVARSGFESGMSYRSAMIFGTCRALRGGAAIAELDLLTDRFFPGRTAEIRPSSAKELAATLVLVLPIEQWSFKATSQFAEDSDEDLAGDAWAGLVPLRKGYEQPIPDPDLRPGIEVPASVRRLFG